MIDAALRIVDEEGAEALSMRTLAQRLDTGTATLYRAVANRGELVAHVVDRVFGEIEFDPVAVREMDWQQACLTAAQGLFDVLSRHRRIAPLLIEQVPVGPNAMLHRERFLEFLLASGFSPVTAARAYATIARFVLGFAAQLPAHDELAQAEPAAIAAFYRRLDPATFPATLAVADVLPSGRLEEEFGFGLRLLVTALSGLRDEA
ncbi:TetR/AcrR family transcriptional regulator [Nocardia blacklockiae]|uniref:TetR/AcrR family transcriptional regulator n=1 Tax=Nocardia blacklockiae TaxID=480036 RepID=UPI002B4B36F6|nr:TetR/AcrR family transcriptional regulator C-terminal domain-containing protein [Nocardia blacklockiae]